MFSNFEELFDSKKLLSKARLAVVAAEDKDTLISLQKASEEGFADPILIGDAPAINKSLEEIGIVRDFFEIIDAKDDESCIFAVTELLKEHRVDVVMKDQIQTGTLMKMFVNKKNSFLKSRTISHIALNHLPIYHKLLCITDTSLNLYPTLDEKKDLIRNAVSAMKRLGVDVPKVAVMAAVEYVNPKMRETVDAAALKEHFLKHEDIGCVIEGPISLDLSIDFHSAKIKGYKSPVAGDADILLVPDLVSGNLLGKAFNYMPHSEFSGFVTGTCVPVVLTSRASSMYNKYLSIKLGIIASETVPIEKKELY